jgi:TolA-binding protein
MEEIVKFAGVVATAVGGGLVALAKWYGERSKSREAQEDALFAAERARADNASSLLLTELRDRIRTLEGEVRQLRDDSCVVRGCRLRRSETVTA